jgi:hypothetical protein
MIAAHIHPTFFGIYQNTLYAVDCFSSARAFNLDGESATFY